MRQVNVWEKLWDNHSKVRQRLIVNKHLLFYCRNNVPKMLQKQPHTEAEGGKIEFVVFLYIFLSFLLLIAYIIFLYTKQMLCSCRCAYSLFRTVYKPHLASFGPNMHLAAKPDELAIHLKMALDSLTVLMYMFSRHELHVHSFYIP